MQYPSLLPNLFLTKICTGYTHQAEYSDPQRPSTINYWKSAFVYSSVILCVYPAPSSLNDETDSMLKGLKNSSLPKFRTPLSVETRLSSIFESCGGVYAVCLDDDSIDISLRMQKLAMGYQNEPFDLCPPQCARLTGAVHFQRWCVTILANIHSSQLISLAANLASNILLTVCPLFLVLRLKMPTDERRLMVLLFASTLATLALCVGVIILSYAPIIRDDSFNMVLPMLNHLEVSIINPILLAASCAVASLLAVAIASESR